MAANSGESSRSVLGTGRRPEDHLPDGLQLQIALDQLNTEGSFEEMIKVLARGQGLDLSGIPISSIPIRYEKLSADDVQARKPAFNRAYRFGTTDMTNNSIFQTMQQQRLKPKLKLLAEGPELVPYRYQILDPNGQEIRLLKLCGAGEAGVFDHLSIEHYPLSAAPVYHCLSYVWGRPERSLPLNCDGGTLMITQNLFDALCASFTRYPEIYLWADGLCINQDDLDERAQQVRLMGKIYSNCKMALAYLGHPKSRARQDLTPAQNAEDGKAVPVAKGEGLRIFLQRWKQRVTMASRLRPKSQERKDHPSGPGSGAESTKQDKGTTPNITPEFPNPLDDKTALRSAISLMNYFVHIWKQYDDFEPIREAVWAKTKIPSRGKEGRPIWEKLLSFWEEDWFYRTWIIPECVLSPKMSIMYGEFAISLDAVMEFWDLASRRGLPLALRHGNLGGVFDILRRISPGTTFLALRQRRSDKDQRLGNMDDAQPASEDLQDQHSTTMEEGNPSKGGLEVRIKPADLLEMLALCRMNLASDNRDKIYAMLDLADDDIARSITPDYHATNTVSDTFVDVAKRYVCANRAAEILEHAGRHHRLAHLPSWVPDWTHQSRSVLRTRLYSCTRDTSPQISLLAKDSSMLSLRAAVLTQIPEAHDALGAPWRYNSSGTDKYRALNTPLMPFKLSQHDPSMFGEMTVEDARVITLRRALGIASLVPALVNEIYPEGFQQAVARTLCADCTWSGERLSSSETALASFMESFETFSNFYSRLVHDAEKPGLRAEYPSKIIYPAGTTSWLLDCSDAEADVRLCKLWPFATALQEAQRGRRFAVLRGGMLALVPWDSEPEDLILLVQGARVPFVVRRIVSGPEVTQVEAGHDSAIFELVGDCYVHGIMDGEMLLRGGAEGEDAEMAIVRGDEGQQYIGKWPTKASFLTWKKFLLR